MQNKNSWFENTFLKSFVEMSEHSENTFRLSEKQVFICQKYMQEFATYGMYISHQRIEYHYRLEGFNFILNDNILRVTNKTEKEKEIDNDFYNRLVERLAKNEKAKTKVIAEYQEIFEELEEAKEAGGDTKEILHLLAIYEKAINN